MNKLSFLAENRFLYFSRDVGQNRHIFHDVSLIRQQIIGTERDELVLYVASISSEMDGLHYDASCRAVSIIYAML